MYTRMTWAFVCGIPARVFAISARSLSWDSEYTADHLKLQAHSSGEPERVGSCDEKSTQELVDDEYIEAPLMDVEDTRKRILVEEFYNIGSFPSFTPLRREANERLPFVIDQSLCGANSTVDTFKLFF